MQNLRHLSLRTLHFALTADPTCEAAVKGLTNLRSFKSASCGLEGNSVMSRLIAILPPLRRLKWDQVGDVVYPEIHELVLRSRHILEHLDIDDLDMKAVFDTHLVHLRAEGAKVQPDIVFPCLRVMNVDTTDLGSLDGRSFPALEWLGAAHIRD